MKIERYDDINMKFEDLNLHSDILKAINGLGYTEPSEVQEKVIPLALKGEDIIAKAQTGSGKTAAFAIPVIQNMDVELNEVQALVLTPTRELAVQVKEDFSSLGLFKRLKTIAIYGKQPMSVQKTQLKQRVHIVVGTPGRTLDHIKNGTLKLDNIKYLIIDEADEMLNMGFIDQVEDIIKYVSKERQTLMFSATLAPEIKELIERHMNDAKTIEIAGEALTVDRINQRYYEIAENHKYNLLRDILTLEKVNQGILFCRTKSNVSMLASRMRTNGYSVTEIHGDMLQRERLIALKEFKEGKFKYIVATDVAARGIDASGVSHVFNYDIPLELEAYVHRIGRTGRAGKSGEAITFVTPHEDKFLKAIEEFIAFKIPKAMRPDRDEVLNAPKEETSTIVKEKPKNLGEVTKIYISGGKKKKVRRGDIVGALINSGNIPGDKIGVIDIYDNYSHVDILEGFGRDLLRKNREILIKGKPFRIKKATPKDF
ncbi:DEAD/DEAH box helicase [Clostridium cavendishii]|nr:DEAD/DEAH box helicase [Clostridium cavendishii]